MRLLPATKATFGKHLPQRINMLKNLVSHLIKREQVVTTKSRAIAIRPIAEMLIRNAIENKPELKAEAEAWLVDKDRTLKLLYGPLRERYAGKEIAFTRVYNLLHREYRHAPLAVIELVDGPKDTIKNLEKYKDQLAKFKDRNQNLFAMELDDMMQNVKTQPRGLMHERHYKRKVEKERKAQILLEAGKVKSRYIMEQFAKNAIGELKEFDEQPDFWVR